MCFKMGFSRYGEVVDANLVRDKGTGKSKGFAFIAYEDQRSTNLAVGWSPLSLICVQWTVVTT
jgi:RNA recognition motif-containing protein